jgi:anti-sigma B factor antagonist
MMAARSTEGENMATNAFRNPVEKLCFSIVGEMTIHCAEELKELIGTALAAEPEVEINLSHVTKLDSTGLRIMLSAKLESIQCGKQVSFIRHSPAVREMLDTCDTGGFFGSPCSNTNF